MTLSIDNYDSFAFHLVRFFEELGETVTVRRNDEIDPAEARAIGPTDRVISPGPGTPSEAGASVDLVRELGDDVPILGVRLGQQCIAHAWGVGSSEHDV